MCHYSVSSLPSPRQWLSLFQAPAALCNWVRDSVLYKWEQSVVLSVIILPLQGPLPVQMTGSFQRLINEEQRSRHWLTARSHDDEMTTRSHTNEREILNQRAEFYSCWPNFSLTWADGLKKYQSVHIRLMNLMWTDGSILPECHIVAWQRPSWPERPMVHNRYSPAEAGRDMHPRLWSPYRWTLGGSTGQSSLHTQTKIHTHTHFQQTWSDEVSHHSVHHAAEWMIHCTHSLLCLYSTHTGQCSTGLPAEPCSPAGPGPPVET